MRKILYGATMLSLLVLMASCGGGQKSGSATSGRIYETQVVKSENIMVESVYPATLKGQEDIEIRPRIDGFIEAIYVDEGSVVRKGQQLFKINSPQAEQDLVSAEAGLVSAQAQVNTAKVNVNRIKPLAEKGIVGEVQLETAEDAHQAALAGLVQAEAQLRNARATVGWTNVTSPVNGFIGEIPYRLGSLVNSANVLTTVANTKSVYAYFSLNEKELLSFLEGLEGKTQEEKLRNAPDVLLETANGIIYQDTGRIETIAGLLNPRTGTANFRAEFKNESGRLRSGGSGTITVMKELHNVFLVPQKATFALQDKVLLYIVNEKNIIEQKTVEVVPVADGQRYAVTAGLKEGDRIVADGIVTLANGMEIEVKENKDIIAEQHD